MSEEIVRPRRRFYRGVNLGFVAQAYIGFEDPRKSGKLHSCHELHILWLLYCSKQNKLRHNVIFQSSIEICMNIKNYFETNLLSFILFQSYFCQ